MHFVCYGFDLQDKALMWSNVSMTSTSSMLKRKERNFCQTNIFIQNVVEEILQLERIIFEEKSALTLSMRTTICLRRNLLD